MTDFPLASQTLGPTGMIGTSCEGSMWLDTFLAMNFVGGSVSAWPAVNQAIYVPVVVSQFITVYQMTTQVGVSAAGNFDVGIYDLGGNRLVSSAPTPIGAAGVQVFNIADTELDPGNYFIAAWCSTITTATFLRGSMTAGLDRVNGVQIQTSLTTGLPLTATFANPTSSYVPMIMASFMQAVI